MLQMVPETKKTVILSQGSVVGFDDGEHRVHISAGPREELVYITVMAVSLNTSSSAQHHSTRHKAFTAQSRPVSLFVVDEGQGNL